MHLDVSSKSTHLYCVVCRCVYTQHKTYLITDVSGCQTLHSSVLPTCRQQGVFTNLLSLILSCNNQWILKVRMLRSLRLIVFIKY